MYYTSTSSLILIIFGISGNLEPQCMYVYTKTQLPHFQEKSCDVVNYNFSALYELKLYLNVRGWRWGRSEKSGAGGGAG